MGRNKYMYIRILFKKIYDLINQEIKIHVPVSIPLDQFIINLLCFPGIYILYSKQKIAYIGFSDNIGNRIINHLDRMNRFKRQSIKFHEPVLDEITKIKIIRFNNGREAYMVEGFLIEHFAPLYNARYNQNSYSTKEKIEFNILADEIIGRL